MVREEKSKCLMFAIVPDCGRAYYVIRYAIELKIEIMFEILPISFSTVHHEEENKMSTSARNTRI